VGAPERAADDFNPLFGIFALHQKFSA
jgi:hypothetical protein